jgi:hypothetical protein
MINIIKKYIYINIYNRLFDKKDIMIYYRGTIYYCHENRRETE